MTEKSDPVEKDRTRRILLCLAGGTPQIITESIYAITQIYGKRLDEVHVITTPTGREKILENLLKENSGKFYRFCDDYGIDASSITFNDRTITLVGSDKGRILTDLVTEEENQAAIDHICRIVREQASRNENVIHASVAGGRKTMGIALTMAMQLFGRAQDHLFHVLVNPDYESHSQFYYPRPKGQKLKFEKGQKAGEPITSRAWVSAGEINFIRLGGVLSEWLNDEDVNYTKLVRRAQDELEKRSGKLMVHLAEERLSIAGQSIELQPREFFLYVLLLQQCARDKDEAFVRLRDIKPAILSRAFNLIAPLKSPLSYKANPSFGIDHIEDAAGYKFLESLLDDVKIEHLGNLETKFNQVRSKVNGKMRDLGWPEQFRICKKGVGMTAAFGLKTSSNSFTYVGPRAD